MSLEANQLKCDCMILRNTFLLISALFISAGVLAEEKPAETKPEAPKKVEASKPQKAKESIIVEEKEGSFKLTFPLKKRTAAAAFERNGNIFFILNNKNNLEIPADSKVNIEKVESKKSAIYKIKASEMNAAVEAGDFTWSLLLTKEKPAEIKGKDLAIKVTGNQPKPSVFIEALKTAEPIVFADPEIGDQIFVVPLYDEVAFVSSGRAFPEFNLIKTMQGIVVDQIADTAEYKVKRDGLEIIGREKLNISEPAAQNKEQKPKEMQVTSILPFAKTFSNEEESYNQIRKNLLAKILETEDSEKSKARLELAEFFFVNEIYDSAFGIVKDIETSDPTFGASPKVQMIKNISLYMMRKYKEALQGFVEIYQNNQNSEFVDEAKLWVWAANYKLKEHKKQSFWDKKEVDPSGAPMPKEKAEEMASTVVFDFITNEKSFIREYPPYLGNDFKLMAVEEKILLGENKVAEKILDSAVKGGAEEYFFNTINLLRGQLAEKDGSFEEAKVIYEKLIDNPLDRLNRGKATLALTKMELTQGSITKLDAIKKLEGVLIIWRGDKLELELLSKIGQLYLDEKEYMKAFKTWRQLVTSFPNTEEAVETAARMRANFVNLFDGGDAYKMEPVAALALYFEFRELTPIGKLGDRIIRQLADYFVKADLLESAAVLLTHQVRYRSQDEERIDIANRLVRVHLLNQKPKLALEILELTELEKKNEEQTTIRKYLKAESLKELAEYGKALQILEGDESYDATRVRADIFWQTKNWEMLVVTLEEKFQARKLTNEALTDREAEDLSRLAVAYAILGERRKLADLRKNFTGLIASEEDKKKFDYVSKDKGDIGYKNFAESSKIDDIEKFLASVELKTLPPKTEESSQKEQEAKILNNENKLGDLPLDDLPEDPVVQ